MMVDLGSSSVPDGVSVDGVDWLPSGARSGIVRVHGRRAPDAPVALPRLVVLADGAEHAFDSLPDTAAAGPDGWRGAYVVVATLALGATGLRLDWPDGERTALGSLLPSAHLPPEAPRLAVVSASEPEGSAAAADPGATGGITPGAEPAPEADATRPDPGSAAGGGTAWAGGEVVERAVIAERRAARAERLADARAAAATDALAAVEALELRAVALGRDLESVRAERDALRDASPPDPPMSSAAGAPSGAAEPRPTAGVAAPPAAESRAGPAPQDALRRTLAERDAEIAALRAAAAPDLDAERRAAALTQALTESVAEVDRLREDLHEQLMLRRTRDVTAGADRIALAALAHEIDTLRRAAGAARAEAAVLQGERDAAHAELEGQCAATAAAHAAQDETRAELARGRSDLVHARDRIAELESALQSAYAETERARAAAAAELDEARSQVEALAATHAAELDDVRAELDRRDAVHAAELDDARVELDRRDAVRASELDEARAELDRRDAVRASEMDDARAELDRVVTAHVAELDDARVELDRRDAAHAAELANLRDDTDRAAAAAAARLAAARAEAAAGIEETGRLRARVTGLEAALRRAEVAREVATASALAARAERRAASVASAEANPGRVAALEADLAALRERLAERESPAAGPLPASRDVIARAAEQVRAAAEHRLPATETAGRLVADLEAAAASLREAAAARAAQAPPRAGDVTAVDRPLPGELQSPPDPSPAADPDDPAEAAPAADEAPSHDAASADVRAPEADPAEGHRPVTETDTAPWETVVDVATPVAAPIVDVPTADAAVEVEAPAVDPADDVEEHAVEPAVDENGPAVDRAAKEHAPAVDPAAEEDAPASDPAAEGDAPAVPPAADGDAPAVDPSAAIAAAASPGDVDQTGSAQPAGRQRPAITSAPADLPGDLARGRGGRTYPPLRGGLVKLAHDDPHAAARLVAGLVPSLHDLLDEPLAFDLAVTELGGDVLGVDVGTDATTVRTLAGPRSRRAARVSLRTDAVTLAEAIAGVGPVPRARRGALKAVRGGRRARRLAAAVRAGERPFHALIAAGARPNPRLALRAFAYAVPPAWTRGHGFTASIVVDGDATVLVARDGDGVTINGDAPAPDVVLVLDRDGFAALLAGDTDVLKGRSVVSAAGRRALASGPTARASDPAADATASDHAAGAPASDPPAGAPASAASGALPAGTPALPAGAPVDPHLAALHGWAVRLGAVPG